MRTHGLGVWMSGVVSWGIDTAGWNSFWSKLSGVTATGNIPTSVVVMSGGVMHEGPRDNMQHLCG